jgi:anti-sigma B factor antagonist
MMARPSRVVGRMATDHAGSAWRDAMKIKRKDADGVVLLSLSGKLMGGPDADKFHDQIKAILDDGQQNVLVDMGGVEWVNSTGLGILIAAHTTVTNAEGHMKLLHVSKRVDSILMVTRLNMIFESYDDEAQALASF